MSQRSSLGKTKRTMLFGNNYLFAYLTGIEYTRKSTIHTTVCRWQRSLFYKLSWNILNTLNVGAVSVLTTCLKIYSHDFLHDKINNSLTNSSQNLPSTLHHYPTRNNALRQSADTSCITQRHIHLCTNNLLKSTHRAAISLVISHRPRKDASLLRTQLGCKKCRETIGSTIVPK